MNVKRVENCCPRGQQEETIVRIKKCEDISGNEGKRRETAINGGTRLEARRNPIGRP